MLKITALIIVALIAAILLYAATEPDIFRVQRTASIKAPPETIFPHIDDLDRFAAWSPYEKKDPNMKKTGTGPVAGKGAAEAWEGNKDVGSGRIEIVESTPPSKVAMNLNMIKPFEAHNIVEFTLEPNGDATNVTWAMHGKTPYLAKIVHVFFNMDSMVGKDFEAGLANLKAIAEK